MRGTPWTSEEERTLRQLENEGQKYAYIACVLGRSEKSVVSHARDMRRREGRETSVQYHKWTSVEIARAVEMYVEGHTAREIAAVIGYSMWAVYNKIREEKKYEIM